jgi:uncharacterized cupredoxin-like copper-binding protein
MYRPAPFGSAGSRKERAVKSGTPLSESGAGGVLRGLVSGRTAGWVASVALTVSVVCALAGPSLADATVSPSARVATAVVNVTAVEYKFTLSRRSAGTGKVTFRIKNKGKLAHDFKINGVTSKLLAPGGSTSITVNFKKKGTYRYLCTVPGHAALGMKGTFRIT